VLDFVGLSARFGQKGWRNRLQLLSPALVVMVFNLAGARRIVNAETTVVVGRL
jgi:hypothetical protein